MSGWLRLRRHCHLFDRTGFGNRLTILCISRKLQQMHTSHIVVSETDERERPVPSVLDMSTCDVGGGGAESGIRPPQAAAQHREVGS